jgi:hypothetical protein
MEGASIIRPLKSRHPRLSVPPAIAVTVRSRNGV